MLTVEEVGRAGQGLVGHLSPDIARRLRGALRDALAEMGEDVGPLIRPVVSRRPVRPRILVGHVLHEEALVAGLELREGASPPPVTVPPHRHQRAAVRTPGGSASVRSMA